MNYACSRHPGESVTRRTCNIKPVHRLTSVVLSVSVADWQSPSSYSGLGMTTSSSSNLRFRPPAAAILAFLMSSIPASRACNTNLIASAPFCWVTHIQQQTVQQVCGADVLLTYRMTSTLNEAGPVWARLTDLCRCQSIMSLMLF